MEIEQQLRLALMPCSPDVALRARVMARVSTGSFGPGGRVRRGRVILLGTIAAAAAAAAPFALQFMSASPPDVAVVPSSTHPMPDAGAAGGLEALPPRPIEDEVVPAAHVPADTSVPPVPTPAAAVPQLPMSSAADKPVGVRTMRVLPLENHAADEATRAAVEQFHASFLEALRRKSGIAVLEPDSGESTGSDADYVLSITGRGPVRPDTFNVSISEGAREQVNGMFSGSMLVNATGLIAPTCADPQRCADPVNLGAMMAERVVDRLASREGSGIQ